MTNILNRLLRLGLVACIAALTLNAESLVAQTDTSTSSRLDKKMDSANGQPSQQKKVQINRARRSRIGGGSVLRLSTPKDTREGK